MGSKIDIAFLRRQQIYAGGTCGLFSLILLLGLLIGRFGFNGNHLAGQRIHGNFLDVLGIRDGNVERPD
jgi:hypothetical protein